MAAKHRRPAAQGHRARKRFGQNFLHDEQVIARIVAAIAPKTGDHIVEIGPGLGALTRPLCDALHSSGKLTLVELDRDLVARLASWAKVYPHVELVQADALEFAFDGLPANGSTPLRAVGNLPYNISTPLLFHLLEQQRTFAVTRAGASLFSDMHFMLQREVVERICAQPGSKQYGRLTVMMQYHARVEALFEVPPGAFEPAPAVESGLLRIAPYATPPVRAHDDGLLAQIVADAFAQRRKTLRNTLKRLCSIDTIEAAGIDPGARAESLSVGDFVALANQVHNTL